MRQRLTELVAHVVRQVPVEREDRAELVTSTGRRVLALRKPSG